MSAHVLLILLNSLRKWDKMLGKPSILSLCRIELSIFNNTRARILDFIYHMTLGLLWNFISAVKTLKFCHYVRNVVMDVINFSENLYTTSGLSLLLHDVISLPDETSCDKYFIVLRGHIAWRYFTPRRDVMR